jgi:hypothetical protein
MPVRRAAWPLCAQSGSLKLIGDLPRLSLFREWGSVGWSRPRVLLAIASGRMRACRPPPWDGFFRFSLTGKTGVTRPRLDAICATARSATCAFRLIGSVPYHA